MGVPSIIRIRIREMAFTDEDRNVLIATATKVENIEGWIGSLPCQQQPPVCTQEGRLVSIERVAVSTRNWVAGIVATILGGGALAILAAFLTKISTGG